MFAQGAEEVALPIAIGDVLPAVLDRLGVVTPDDSMGHSTGAGGASAQCFGSMARSSRNVNVPKSGLPSWPNGGVPFEEGRRLRSPDRSESSVAGRCK